MSRPPNPRKPFDNRHNYFNAKNTSYIIEECSVNQRGLLFKDEKVIFGAALEHICWLDENFSGSYIGKDKRFNTIDQPNLIFERLTGFQKNIELTLKDAKVFKHKGSTLYLKHPFWAYEYGHFFDTFQKISLLKEDIKIDSILINYHHKINEFDLHLKIMNLDQYEKIIVTNAKHIHSFEKLIYIPPVGGIANFTEESLSCIRKLYFKYFKIDEDKTPTKKLFLTRVSPLSRILKNSKVIHDKLIDNGITIFDGTEDLKTIVEAFSSASHIAAVHGSLLANSIFSNKETRFLEFCPNTRQDFTFQNKIKMSGSYIHKLIPCDDNFDVELDLNELFLFYNSR